MLTMNMIGAGSVGQTLGYLLVKHQMVQIQGIVNQSSASAFAAIGFMGQGQYYPEIGSLPHAAVTMLTTPDDTIQVVAEALSCNPYLQSGDVVLHCSGALTSDCLASLRARGVLVASMHPMMSFKQPPISVRLYTDIPCAVEGDPEAIAMISPLFTAIGSWLYPIHKAQKALYHAAAVFASNYVVTLAQQAQDCFLDAGLSEVHARRVWLNIMQTTMSNLSQTARPQFALTGPLQRGDVATVTRHLQALRDPDCRALYSALGRVTLSLTDLSVVQREAILAVLSE